MKMKWREEMEGGVEAFAFKYWMLEEAVWRSWGLKWIMDLVGGGCRLKYRYWPWMQHKHADNQYQLLSKERNIIDALEDNRIKRGVGVADKETPYVLTSCRTATPPADFAHHACDITSLRRMLVLQYSDSRCALYWRRVRALHSRMNRAMMAVWLQKIFDDRVEMKRDERENKWIDKC